MKVTVTCKFRDKYTGEIHLAGEMLSVSPERAAELSQKNVIAPNMVAEDEDLKKVEPAKVPESEKEEVAPVQPEKKKPVRKTTTKKR